MVNRSDLRFFEKARQVADVSDFKKTHVGCVAIYKNNIVGIGCNTNKTHPIQAKYNVYREKNQNPYLLPKLHAEMNCINSIRHLNIDFHKVRLYVYRIRNDRPCGLSRPCKACMAAIRSLGIHEIYYTTNNGYAYEYIMTDEKEII